MTNKNRFQILAHTDSLTNIYNRYGFDELAAKMIAKNPKTHFVAALFDIDDFKFINDIYGHGYGDKALKCLADSMKDSHAEEGSSNFIFLLDMRNIRPLHPVFHSSCAVQMQLSMK